MATYYGYLLRLLTMATRRATRRSLTLTLTLALALTPTPTLTLTLTRQQHALELRAAHEAAEREAAGLRAERAGLERAAAAHVRLPALTQP